MAQTVAGLRHSWLFGRGMVEIFRPWDVGGLGFGSYSTCSAGLGVFGIVRFGPLEVHGGYLRALGSTLGAEIPSAKTPPQHPSPERLISKSGPCIMIARSTNDTSKNRGARHVRMDLGDSSGLSEMMFRVWGDCQVHVVPKPYFAPAHRAR